MSLLPDEDVLTREIETWRGFIEKLPSEDDKAIMTKLLNDSLRKCVELFLMSIYHSFDRH